MRREIELLRPELGTAAECDAGNGGRRIAPTLTIPTATISQSGGNAIRAQLVLPAIVNIRIAGRQWRDGTMDNAIVAHEWGTTSRTA